MDDQVISTKHCSNCKRDVAESNFVMHEIHCRKNIILCPKCSEPVPKVSMEEHIEETHALVNCDLCSFAVERSLMEKHKSDLCSKRSQTCEFCELAVPANELGKHEDYCGTRTELCNKCQNYIMYKDRIMHDESNCNLPERTEPAAKAEADFFEYPGDSSHGLPSFYDDVPFRSPELQRRANGRGRYRNAIQGSSYHADPGMDAKKSIPRKNATQSSAAEGGSRWNRSTFDRPRPERRRQTEDDAIYDDFLKFALTKDSNVVKDLIAPKNDHSCLDLDDELFLPCEFCNESFPSSFIIHHQVNCNSQFEEPAFRVNGDYRENLLEEKPAKPVTAKSSFADSLHDSEAMLPCEFCDELFSVDEFMVHQFSCEVRLPDSGEGEGFYRADNVRRPPSLPSGLNQLSTEDTDTQSSLKLSSSTPHYLSELGRAAGPAVANRKPVNAVVGNRQRNITDGSAGVSDRLPQNAPRKPTIRQQQQQLPAELRMPGSWPGFQTRHRADATAVRPIRPSGAGLQSNSAATRPLAIRPSYRGPQGRSFSVIRASASDLSTVSHPTLAASRPVGSNQGEHQANRTAARRHEGNLAAGRSNYTTTRNNSQKKSSQTWRDAIEKS